MFESFISMAATDVSAATATLHTMAPDPELKAITDNIHRQTAGPAGDIHVEMQSLVDFYNTLSRLHEELADTIQDFRTTAQSLNEAKVGGKVPGVQQAWQAMTESLGANRERHSLAGNLQAVDNEVVACMAALQHNAKSYASQEDASIAGFGRASGTAEKKHGKKSHKSDHKSGTKHDGKGSQAKGEQRGMVIEGGETITSTSGSFGGVRAK